MDLECIAEKSRSCCNGVFPNWLGRYNVGKRVELMTKRVKQFNKRFTVVSLPMIGQRNDAIVDMVGSRKGPRDEILAALEDDETNMIGLCGMGGSGKTHLIKQLCTEVHSLKLFDTIVFVVPIDFAGKISLLPSFVILESLSLPTQKTSLNASRHIFRSPIL